MASAALNLRDEPLLFLRNDELTTIDFEMNAIAENEPKHEKIFTVNF